MRSWFFPVLPRIALLASVSTLVGAAYMILPLWDWQPQYWGRLDLVTRERTWPIVIIGGVVAGLSARSCRQPSVVYPFASKRSQADVQAGFVWRLSAIIAGATVLGVVVGACRLLLVGATGPVSVVALIGNLLGVFCSVPVGFLLGIVLPRIAWSLSVIFFTIVILMIPWISNELVLVNTGMSSRSLAVMWGLSIPEVGWMSGGAVSLLRICYFMVLGFVCMAVAAGWVARPVRFSTMIRPALFAVPLGLVWSVALVSHNLPLLAPDGKEAVCDSVYASKVCVHPAHKSLLPVVQSAVAGVLVVVPPDQRPAYVGEALYAPTGATGSVILPAELPSSPSAYVNAIAAAVAHDGSGVEVCNKLAAQEFANTGSEPGEIRTASFIAYSIKERLMMLGGGDPASIASVNEKGLPEYSLYFERLAALSDAEFGAWYLGHSADIVSCRVSLSAVP